MWKCGENIVMEQYEPYSVYQTWASNDTQLNITFVHLKWNDFFGQNHSTANAFTCPVHSCARSPAGLFRLFASNEMEEEKH